MHRLGVAHNDLAKEPNLLVTTEGQPALVDFQLATITHQRGRLFRMLAREDIRHLLKHKRTYCADARDVRSQIQAILKDVAEENNHISPNSPKNLKQSFNSFNDTWSPRIAGQINDMQIKLAKLEGEFVWHHHPVEDELFFVHKGTLLMKFRDRDEYVKEGEFIIVPHGVEHCPVAVDDICEVVLLEPRTTLNTGTATDTRTVSNLAHV